MARSWRERAMPGKGDGRGSRNLDLSSSRLFYRELDALPMMTGDEEAALAARTDLVRMEMLRAVTAVPEGREMFLGPLRRLAGGVRVDEDLLDDGYWSLSDGVMAPGKRREFRVLLDGASATPPDEACALGLRLNWQRVEEIGGKVFSSVDRLERLEREMASMPGVPGWGGATVEEAAVRFASASSRVDAGDFSNWKTWREIVRAGREADLVRLDTGTGPEALHEAAALFRSARDELDSILETLVESNLRLVISVTRKFPAGSVMEEMDLIQEGCQGLLYAARRFDFRRGFRFSTYAVWWIRRHISTAVTRDRVQEGVPPHVQKKRTAVQEEVDSFAAERFRYPTSGEIARELDMTESQVEMIRATEGGQLSMDRAWNDGDGACLGDLLRSGEDGPECVSIDRDMSRRIETALDSLPQRERSVISLRFGLFDGEPQSLESVSRIFGVSRERIRQIQTSALARLRDLGISGPVQQEDEKG